ncbi:MAG: hypothetical protein ACI9A1_001881, partial [Lentimonas sp.]
MRKLEKMGKTQLLEVLVKGKSEKIRIGSFLTSDPRRKSPQLRPSD